MRTPCAMLRRAEREAILIGAGITTAPLLPNALLDVTKLVSRQPCTSCAMPCRAEKEAILIGAGITRAPFPPDALSELPPPGEWAPSAADLATRRDLRGQLIASIDPPGLPRKYPYTIWK